MDKELKKLCKKHKLENKKLAAIGRIEHIEHIQAVLRRYGVVLDAVVDNDSKKEGLLVNNVPVYKPEKYLLPVREDVLILIYSPKYWKDIREQFQGFGYREGEQFFVLEKPSAVSAAGCVWKGVRIYNRMERQYGKNVHVLVCRGPVGDFFLFGLFLKSYLKKQGITRYVFAGDSKGYAKIADLFGIKDIVLLSEDDTDFLIQAYVFGCVGKRQIHVLTIWQKLSFNSCLVRYGKGFSFMDTVRTFIYGLPADAERTVPLFSALDTGLVSRCEALGMKRGRTVILAPYAYSLQSLPVHFWQELADRLKAAGYVVCINVDSGKEACMLDGVIPVSFPLMQCVAVMEFSGFFIGIRSGFVDVTSGADCKKIILYPEYIAEQTENQWHRTDMEFSGLKNMGLCDDAVEMEYPLQDAQGRPYIVSGVYAPDKEHWFIDRILHNLQGRDRP